MIKNDYSEKWKQLLLEYRNSGKTVKEWCQLNKLRRSALYYWMKKLSSNIEELDTSVKWASIPISIPIPNDQLIPVTNSITLKIGEFSMELKTGFEKSVLKDVLSVVMQLC